MKALIFTLKDVARLSTPMSLVWKRKQRRIDKQCWGSDIIPDLHVRRRTNNSRNASTDSNTSQVLCALWIANSKVLGPTKTMDYLIKNKGPILYEYSILMCTGIDFSNFQDNRDLFNSTSNLLIDIFVVSSAFVIPLKCFHRRGWIT